MRPADVRTTLRLRALGQLEVLERHRWAQKPDGGTGPRADAAEAYLIGCYGAAVLEYERRTAALPS